MLDQKITYQLIQIMLLEEDETAIRSGIKSLLGIMGFSTSVTILNLWFFPLNIYAASSTVFFLW